MAEATTDAKTPVPDDATPCVRPEAALPDKTPNWTVSYERLSGFLQN